MLDVDDYVTNDKDTEVSTDLYDTYINADLNFPDADSNAVYTHVNKQVWGNYGQAVGVVNRNLLLDTIKYEV